MQQRIAQFFRRVLDSMDDTSACVVVGGKPPSIGIQTRLGGFEWRMTFAHPDLELSADWDATTFAAMQGVYHQRAMTGVVDGHLAHTHRLDVTYNPLDAANATPMPKGFMPFMARIMEAGYRTTANLLAKAEGAERLHYYESLHAMQFDVGNYANFYYSDGQRLNVAYCSAKMPALSGRVSRNFYAPLLHLDWPAPLTNEKLVSCVDATGHAHFGWTASCEGYRITTMARVYPEKFPCGDVLARNSGMRYLCCKHTLKGFTRRLGPYTIVAAPSVLSINNERVPATYTCETGRPHKLSARFDLHGLRKVLDLASEDHVSLCLVPGKHTLLTCYGSQSLYAENGQ